MDPTVSFIRNQLGIKFEPQKNNNTRKKYCKLVVLEMIIEKLFTIRKPIPLLEKKLSELENIIMDLNWEEADPLMGRVQLTSWRLKLADWWTKYARLGLCDEGRNADFYFNSDNQGRNQSYIPLPSTSHDSFGFNLDNILFSKPTNYDLSNDRQQTLDPTINKYQFSTTISSVLPQPTTTDRESCTSYSRFGDIPAYGQFASNFQLQDPTPYILSPLQPNLNQQQLTSYAKVASFPSSSPSVKDDKEKEGEEKVKSESVDQLCLRLTTELSAHKKVMAAGEDNSNNFQLDIDSLKSFLHLITLVDKQAAVYRFDRPLQDALFEAAFERLSASFKSRFNAANPISGQRMLYTLIRFFKDAIIEYHQAKEARWQKGKVVKPEKQASTCRFCFQPDHLVRNCQALAETLCFCCNAYGHSSRKCPLRMRSYAAVTKENVNSGNGKQLFWKR